MRTARSVAIRGREGTSQIELGDDVANAVLTPSGGRAGIGVGAVLTDAYIPEVAGCLRSTSDSPASYWKMNGTDRATLVAHTLRAEGFDASEDGTGRGTPIISVNARQDPDVAEECLGLLDSDGTTHAVINRHAVRRLTPRECERLMAFPDDWTLIPWRNKPASECPDGPRYRCLGNSMAVNVMDWLGRRIAFVDTIKKARHAAGRAFHEGMNQRNSRR